MKRLYLTLDAMLRDSGRMQLQQDIGSLQLVVMINADALVIFDSAIVAFSERGLDSESEKESRYDDKSTRRKEYDKLSNSLFLRFNLLLRISAALSDNALVCYLRMKRRISLLS